MLFRGDCLPLYLCCSTCEIIFTIFLQLLEWVEQSKLFEFGERDYASRVDLTAKVYGLYKAEQYIEKIPAPHRGEIVYRTLLANVFMKQMSRKQSKSSIR